MTTEENEAGKSELYTVSLFLKGAESVLELLFGFLLLVSRAPLARVGTSLAVAELALDPVRFLGTPGGIFFAAVFLIFRGTVSLFLAQRLMREEAWAYTAAMDIVGAFAAFELIASAFSGSLSLFLLSMFDVMIVWLVFNERKRIRKMSGV